MQDPEPSYGNAQPQTVKVENPEMVVPQVENVQSQQDLLDEQLAFQRVQTLNLNYKQSKNFIREYECGHIMVNDTNKDFVENEIK